MILASATPWTELVGLGAAAAYGACALGASRLAPQRLQALVWLAWTLHAGVLVAGLADGQPRFGFAPALSVTTWLVGLVYALEGYVYPQLNRPWQLSGLGAAAVLLALVFPGSVLHNTLSPLLPLHWALGIASYGLFAIAVVHAWLLQRAEGRLRLGNDVHTGLPLLTLERLTFRFVSVGFVLLSATLVAGFFFGTHLFGSEHSFKWDHKTVFSVLSWATIAVLMVGRWRFGWRGRTASRFLYIGSGFLLLAYVGSRFVLEVLLGRTL
jgi:ABC-type uncharacterized transport system permease subunit